MESAPAALQTILPVTVAEDHDCIDHMQTVMLLAHHTLLLQQLGPGLLLLRQVSFPFLL